MHLCSWMQVLFLQFSTRRNSRSPFAPASNCENGRGAKFERDRGQEAVYSRSPDTFPGTPDRTLVHSGSSPRSTSRFRACELLNLPPRVRSWPGSPSSISGSGFAPTKAAGTIRRVEDPPLCPAIRVYTIGDQSALPALPNFSISGRAE